MLLGQQINLVDLLINFNQGRVFYVSVWVEVEMEMINLYRIYNANFVW